MKYPITPEIREYLLKELKFQRSQASQESRLLQDKEYCKDWRMKQLAENNLKSSQRQIDNCKLRLTYGDCEFPPPSVSTANWDYDSWAKYYESVGIEKL